MIFLGREGHGAVIVLTDTEVKELRTNLNHFKELYDGSDATNKPWDRWQECVDVKILNNLENY